MTHATCVTLEGVSYQLPDGSSLFSDINLHLDPRHTGLVGRNGVGKRVLACLIAGDVSPTTGRCVPTATVYYLALENMPKQYPGSLVVTSHTTNGFWTRLGLPTGSWLLHRGG